jgi:hypothetical protein
MPGGRWWLAVVPVIAAAAILYFDRYGPDDWSNGTS